MKRKDITMLHAKSVEDVEKLIAEEAERLRELRADLAAGKVKNIGLVRTAKKNVARLLTVRTMLKKKKTVV